MNIVQESSGSEQPAIIIYARKLHNAGFSIGPVWKDGKRPTNYPAKYMWSKGKASDEQMSLWFIGNDSDIEIYGEYNRTFGLDFDNHSGLHAGIFDEFKRRMISVWGRAKWKQYISEFATKTAGGYRAVWRCERRPEILPAKTDGLTLAWYDDAGASKGFIEIKSRFVVPGGITPGYRYAGTDLLDISKAILLPHDQQLLIETAAKMGTAPAPTKPAFVPRQSIEISGDKRPGDYFDECFRKDPSLWQDLLERAGWDHCGAGAAHGEERYSRPGGSKISASVNYEGNGLLHVFSDNAAPFKAGENYGPFAVYAQACCRGNFEEAARRISETGAGLVEPFDAVPIGDIDLICEGVDIPEPVIIPIIAQDAPQTLPDARGDHWTGYLWRGNHALITDEERVRRIKSIDEVRRLIPETGFFPDYIRSKLPQTDGPVIFHLSAALVLAGHLLNRKVHLEHGSRKVRPQIWAANIGASSVVRKSTSKDMMAAYLRADPVYRRTVLASSSFSMEGIYRELGTMLEKPEDIPASLDGAEAKEEQSATTGDDFVKGVGLFCVDELGSWLQALDAGRERGSGKTIVTEWYDYADRYWHKSTAHSGIYWVYKPCVSILGCSTVEWVNEHATDADLRGGFFPRWLFLTAETRDYTLPFPDAGIDTGIERSIERMKGIRQKYGISPGAFQRYWEWVREWEPKVDDQLRSWAARLTVYVLKIAMIFEASVGDAAVVTETNMTLAIRLVERVYGDIRHLVTTQIAFTDDDRGRLRVMNVVKKAGRIQHGIALRHSNMNAKEFKSHMTTLAQSGYVRVEEHESAGKKTYVYCWV
jgi:Protein of unknown function (DUF3987)